MSILKKVFIGAVLLATASFVVAGEDDGITMHAAGFAPVLGPESYTSSTTQGRFGLDVDDYMDVNSWSGVNFDKGFGFLSYNSGVNNGISLGYATHLFGAYVGLWFAGHGGDFTLSSTLRAPTPESGDGYKEFLSYKTLKNGIYAMAVLLGKGDKGLKATLVYDPQRGGSQYAFTDDGYKQGENYLLYADLALGVGDTKNYHVGFYADVARDTSTAGADNGTFYDLYAGIGGLPFLFGFGVDLDTRLRIFPATVWDGGTDTTSAEGELDIIVKADISRGFTFAPIDRLAVKAKVGLPVEFGISSPAGHGYTDANIDLVISPVAKVGLQYALRPEKVNFNLGTKLGLGSLGLGISNTADNPDDNPDKTTLTLGYNSNAIDLEFSSGFTLFLGKSITLDADWGIIDALVGKNLESGSAFNGNNSVDEAVGKILFNKFSLLLSVKL